MARSLWKQPFSCLKKDTLSLFQKHNSINLSKNSSKRKEQEKTIYVWCRNSTVLPIDVGRQVQIYNGKKWIFRKIVIEMVGHKFGEFWFTKKKAIYKK